MVVVFVSIHFFADSTGRTLPWTSFILDLMLRIAVMNRNISITLLLFLISIMDLSVCFPPNYYSYPFCTAQYGLMIFRTITRTVLSKTLTVLSNARLLT